ncbi:MAG: LuxR C-terminal-related transcriptional regulator [Pseudomonadota bacterium]|nr:LuxR C-terminal-related transcriptional regulator [Pseudomonadota bacterium]
MEQVPDCVQAEQRLRMDGREIDAVVLHLTDISDEALKPAFATIMRSRGKPVAVMLPREASVSVVWRCFVNGAQAVLTEDMDAKDVGQALSLMQSGQRVATLDGAVIPDPTLIVKKLSDRELQVLAGVCKGLQNKEIAHDFNIKEVTVKMHVRAVIRKLEAKNRTHAAMIARNLGLVS